jgi:D-lactate dehydrogenase
VPDGIGDLCCGTPWKSKGLTQGWQHMRAQVLPTLHEATQGGQLPVVVDAASCTDGLLRLLENSNMRVLDAVAFAAERLLPRLPAAQRLPSLTLHPTCASVQLGLDATLGLVAAAVADEVVIPVDAGCCAFAGDRGLLHPELTASATAREAAEVGAHATTAYASVNRTCELGLARATGQPYEHVLEVLERVTRSA